MVEISVIMYVYNNQIFLKESLDSILNQTFEDIEVICVDDGSTDYSPRILQDYQQKYDQFMIKTGKHQGLSGAINNTLNEVAGKYVYITNPGCTLDKDALKLLYEKAEKNNSELTVSDKNILAEDENNLVIKSFDNVSGEVFDYTAINDLTKIDVSPETKLFSTSFIKENKLKISNDNLQSFVYYFIFKSENISYIPEALVTCNEYYMKLTNKNDKRLFNIISDSNMLIELFREHDQLEKNKNKLYDNKMSITIDTLNKIAVEYKCEFYNSIRDDFKQILLNDEFNKEFLENISPYHRKIFEMIIISENYYEYELLKKTYYKMNDYYNILIDRNYFKQAQEKENKIEE